MKYYKTLRWMLQCGGWSRIIQNVKTEKTKDYRPRVLDERVSEQLDAFGAVLIRGPKWSGKTTTSEHFANSAIYLDDYDRQNEYEMIARSDVGAFLEGEKPHLIDEWQAYPATWDAVRRFCDHSPDKTSLFILTGSYSPKQGNTKHTGTMRISTIDMETMSLFESGESSGDVSFISLFDPGAKISGRAKLSKSGITHAIVRGGWPVAVLNEKSNPLLYGKQALRGICSTDLKEATGMEVDPGTALALVRSLARNITIPVKNETIISDMAESGHPVAGSTFYLYMNGLKRLFVLREVPAWNPNVRSATSIRSLPKREFFEPSIACAALNLGEEALSKDYITRGYLFESLCGRDLSVYASKYDGELNYYRDRFKLECDFVIHLPDGRYGLFECKCGDGFIEAGAAHLNRLEALIQRHRNDNPNVRIGMPSCKVVLTDGNLAFRREDGVIILPLSCLRP